MRVSILCFERLDNWKSQQGIADRAWTNDKYVHNPILPQLRTGVPKALCLDALCIVSTIPDQLSMLYLIKGLTLQ